MSEYYSLRYIWLSETVGKKASRGYFVYCYKMEVGKNSSKFIDFIDKYVIESVCKHHEQAKLSTIDMLNNGSWQKWLALLTKTPIDFYNTSTANLNDIPFLIIDKYRGVTYPSFKISYYPQFCICDADPSFPFNKIEFRYPIQLTDEFSEFSKELSQFVEHNVFTFQEACPMIKFNNMQGLQIFTGFHKHFSEIITRCWPELMDLEIDVYNETKLKPFMTCCNAFVDKSILDDSPYISFCYRPTEQGSIENDIIENTTLCSSLQLTVLECYALIAHEIGHFVEDKKFPKRKDNDLEIACDTYTTHLGLSEHLKSALQKIIASGICSQQKNAQMQERVSRL